LPLPIGGELAAVTNRGCSLRWRNLDLYSGDRDVMSRDPML